MHWKICTFLKKCLKSVHNKTCLQPSAVQFKQQLLVPWKSKYCAYLRLMCDCCYGWFKCCLNPTPTHFPVTLFELHQKKNPNLKPWWKLEKGQDCQAWSKAQMQITIKKTSLWRTPPSKMLFWNRTVPFDTSEKSARLIICHLFTPCSSYLNSRVEQYRNKWRKFTLFRDARQEQKAANNSV